MVGNNFGAVLEKLKTNEGKAGAVVAALNYWHVPVEYIEKGVDWYEQAGKLDNAYFLAARYGLNRRAREVSAKIQKQKQEKKEEDILLKKEQKKWTEEFESIDDAVAAAIKIGCLDDTIKMREQQQQFADAAKIAQNEAEKYGMLYSYGRTLNSIFDILIPANIKEKREKYLKIAIDNYERAKWYDSAATLAQNAGRIERAIKIYEKAEEQEKAIYIAVKNGNKKRAILVYEKLGQFNDAANFANKNGMHAHAALYKEVCDAIDPNLELKRKQKEEEKRQQNDLILQLEESLFSLDDFCSNYVSSLNINQTVREKFEKLVLYIIEHDVQQTAYQVLLSFLTGTPMIATLLSTGGLFFAGIGYEAWNGLSALVESSTDQTLKIDCRDNKKTISGKYCRIARYDATIEQNEKKYNIPDGLLAAIAMQESGGDPTYIGKKGAGLFELSETDVRNQGYYTLHFGLTKMAEQEHYCRERMATYDSRFNIEETTAAAATKLVTFYNTTLFDPKRVTQESRWDFAVAAFEYGANTSMQKRQVNYVQRVRTFQEYYLAQD